MLPIQIRLAPTLVAMLSTACAVYADSAPLTSKTLEQFTERQNGAFEDVRRQFAESTEAAKYALRFERPEEAIFERSEMTAEFAEFLSNPETIVLKVSEHDSKPVFFVSESAYRNLEFADRLLPYVDKLENPAEDRGAYHFNLKWVVIEDLSNVAQSYRETAGIFPRNDVVVAVEHVGAFQKGKLFCTSVFSDELFSEDPLDDDAATREFIRVWNDEARQQNSVIGTTCSEYKTVARGGGREPVRVGRGESLLTVNGIRLPAKYFESDVQTIETITLEAFAAEMRKMVDQASIIK